MKKTIILLILLSSFLFAEINECQSDIYYGNGIMTTKKEARHSLYRVLKPAILKKIYSDDKVKMNKLHNFDLSYNYSAKEKFGDTAIAKALDLMESYSQLGNTSFGWKAADILIGYAGGSIAFVSKWTAKRVAKDLMKRGLPKMAAEFLADEIVGAGKDALINIAEALNDYDVDKIHDKDLKEMVGKYTTSIKDGHGVILITHSQGNLFAVEATNRVLFSMGEQEFKDWMRKYVYHVSIASPATKFASDNSWLISLDNDVVANNPGSVGTNFRNPIRYFTHEADSITPAMAPDAMNEWIHNPPIDASSPDGYWLDGAVPPSFTKKIQADTGFDSYGVMQSFTMHVVPDEWDYLQTDFHAFNYYMGLIKFEANIGGGKVVRRKSKKTREGVIDGIGSAIKMHKDAPSQWKKSKETGCLCKDKRIQVVHKFDATLNAKLAASKVFDFNEEGKIYPVNNSYVRAKCGGEMVAQVKKESVCYELLGDTSDVIGQIERKPNDDLSISPGLFTAKLTWQTTSVEMEMSNSLMPQSVSGCGINLLSSAGLMLYDVYPGTYALNVTADGYQDIDDTNLSDTVTLSITAVNAGKGDLFIVTRASQYAHLGHDGHVADIVITKPDPAGPAKLELVSASSGSYAYTYYVHVPRFTTVVEPPLCAPAKSCGCLPCKYDILMYLNQTRLGPISGANYILYKATEEDDANREILYEGITTISNEIDKAGILSLPVPYKGEEPRNDEERELMQKIADYDGDFILEVSGGFDIDRNDDLKVDSRFTQVNGKLHMILSKENLLENDYKVNILTEIAYQVSRDLLGKNYDQERLQARLDDVAKRVLIEKLYPEEVQPLGRDDLFYWIPSAHKNWLTKPYDTMLTPIINKIYTGEDIFDDAYTYVYEAIESNSVPLLKSQWFEINEDVDEGTLIGDIVVESEGNSSIVSYSISGEGSDFFTIDAEGKIFLAEGKKLDFENSQLHKSVLVAENADGQSRPVTLYIVVRNIKDSPEDIGFEGGVIAEDASSGDLAGTIKFDEGAAPIQKIDMGGVDKNSFRVDLDGKIYVSDAANFDYEKRNTANITLQAFNSYGGSRIIPVRIAITDAVDTPIVQKLDVRLEENATVAQEVGNVTILSNDPLLEVNLTGSGSENFAIDLDGRITVASAAQIDYEARSNYVLQVVAANVQGVGRAGTVIIRIDNVVDAPQLKETVLHVFENSAMNSAVGKVLLDTHGSSEITGYKLYGSGHENFAVDTDGTVTLINNQLDRSDQKYFKLFATATNSSGESMLTKLLIYVDTQRPILDVLHTDVFEDAQEGMAIGAVNVSSSKGDIIAARLEGEGSSNFTIDLDLNIKVANGAQLNYEERQKYNLTVIATNKAGESEPVAVYIRVLDIGYPPIIEGFSSAIEIGSDIGSTVGNVTVLDNGDSPIKKFEFVESSDYFSLDNEGVVRLEKSLIEQNTTSFILKAFAENTFGRSLAVDINITIFEDIVIENFTALLFDASSSSATVGQINIVTNGAPVTSIVLLGEGSEDFTVDNNGTLHIATDVTLDYNTKSDYNLTVVVNDTFEAEVNIHISKGIIGSVSTPGNAMDIALSSDGTKAYLVSTKKDYAYYDYGLLKIIDINNSSDVSTIASINTRGSAISIVLSSDGTKAYIGSWNFGVQIVDISKPETPVIIGSVSTPSGNPIDIVLSSDETRAYVTDGRSGLQIIDISDPVSPFIMGSVDGYTERVLLSIDETKVILANDRLQIVDIGNLETPTVIASLDAIGIIEDMVLSSDGTKVYVATWSSLPQYSGLYIVDISDFVALSIIGFVATPNYARGISLSSDEMKAYIADSESGLQIVDISDPTDPFIMGSVDTFGGAFKLALSPDETKAYVADGSSGLQIIDIGGL